MHEFIGYTFSGLASAAIYAIAATGLVLTYTTTGVFNFSHGAMGMVAAFTYWEMRFGWHWPAPIALAVCVLVLAPLFGAVLELMIMRRLEGTSETTKLVVTISLLLSLLGFALWVWDPNKSRPIRKFWEGDIVTILDVRVPYHQLSALVIAAAVAIGLRVLLYRSRIGVAMRACVDDRSLALLNGAKQARVAMTSWAIGVGLAAVAGILISPTLNLSALPLTLLIINAYAAAMIGRLRSLPMTFVGALILGLANDYSAGYLTRIHTARQYLTGLRAAMPVIILFIVLLLLPQARLRGHSAVRTREISRVPTWRGGSTMAVIIVVGAAMMTAVLSKSDLLSVSRMWGLGIIGLSLIPLVGYAGQISLCQLSFAAIGMIVVGHAGAHGSPLALVLAPIVAGAVGALVALPSLRLSGVYLALSTAAFAVAMDRWIFLLPPFTVFGHKFDIFKGQALSVPDTKMFGLHLGGSKSFFIFGAVTFSLAALLIVAIRRSSFGQRLLALKDSPAACATLCMNPTTAKLAVFALSAALAGFGGAIYGQALGAVSPDNVGFFNSLVLLMVLVIGGISSIGGALFGGLFLGAPILANVFPSLKQLQTVLVGLAGIGLGEDPNGMVPRQIRPGWDHVYAQPTVLVATLAAVVAAWVLRITHVLANWPFAIVCIAIGLIAPVVAKRLNVDRSETTEKPVKVGLSAPLEWLGVTQEYSEGDLQLIDAKLGIPALTAGGQHGAA